MPRNIAKMKSTDLAMMIMELYKYLVSEKKEFL